MVRSGKPINLRRPGKSSPSLSWKTKSEALSAGHFNLTNDLDLAQNLLLNYNVNRPPREREIKAPTSTTTAACAMSGDSTCKIMVRPVSDHSVLTLQRYAESSDQ
ncbi:MAG: hypothetical protein B6D70_07500 [gamma proteobacterium symbiont of Stewartia floridana]|nr:MAG: hypothetical protein B6D70_07500 [gamma proteobacterium symbiont of Stewartia floridana]RLW62961.1 MAG: hypothetical protein B6D73_17620 [gamma proteobacterium symbiont of Stewartia floridana]